MSATRDVKGLPDQAANATERRFIGGLALASIRSRLNYVRKPGAWPETCHGVRVTALFTGTGIPKSTSRRFGLGVDLCGNLSVRIRGALSGPLRVRCRWWDALGSLQVRPPMRSCSSNPAGRRIARYTGRLVAAVRCLPISPQGRVPKRYSTWPHVATPHMH